MRSISLSTTGIPSTSGTSATSAPAADRRIRAGADGVHHELLEERDAVAAHRHRALPQVLVERVTLAFAATTAFTSSAAAELFTQLLETGAADRLIANKRLLVTANRHAAERALGASRIGAHAMSPHLWIRLSSSIESHELADRARMRGIAIAPASSFAIDRTVTTNAMRVSIGAISDARQLESALRTLASLIENPRMGSGTVV